MTHVYLRTPEQVGAGSVAATTGFSLSLVPECAPGSCGGPTCASGCPRRPAKVYVKSCPEDKCLPEDRFPSQGSRDKEVWGRLKWKLLNRALSHRVVVFVILLLLLLLLLLLRLLDVAFVL